MFSFQVYGTCRFEEYRVIPVDYVKEFCFGFAPTIYRETLDQRRLRADSNSLESTSTLQLASRREIADTLAAIGCNNNTVQCFIDESTRTAHHCPGTYHSFQFSI
jgi:hypothetical protein